jgi:hypothetical protein
MNLFTQAVTFTDPGPTSTTPTPITVYDIPSSIPLPSSLQELVTPDHNNSYWRSVELTAVKRMTNKWSMTASFLGTWANTPNNYTTAGAVGGSGTGVIPYYPTYAYYNEARTYNSNFRVFGTYQAKWGVIISPIFRFQLGPQLAREVVVTGLRIGTITVPVDPVGSYRQENLAIFDTRIEKQFTFKDRYKIGVFFDAFNINNSNAAQPSGGEDNVTGTKTTTVNGQKVTYQRFLAPLSVISPRIVRLGVKFSF